MKKIVSLLIALLVLVSFSALSAQEAPQINLNVKAGIAYPSDIEQVGFDSELGLDVWINKFFAVGILTGFGWISKEYDSGESLDFGPTATLSASEDLNIYSLPVIGNIKIGLGNFKETYGITPYVSAGAGYLWVFHRMSDANETFSGFAWQVAGGVAFDLGEGANGMQVLVEAGYRGTEVETEYNGKDYELEMSGLIVHLGVSFPLSGGDSY